MYRIKTIHHKFSIIIFIIVAFVSISFPIYAQNLDSSTYRLISPSTETVNGTITSSTYAALVDSSPVSDYITTSSTYENRGGTAAFIEAAVPQISCFETSTTSGTCAIGSNGMQEVCSSPGCYDRAKFKINNQSNVADTRYATQISTSSDFTTGVSFVDGTTRLLKSTLTVNDFLYQCDWEGTTAVGYCGSPNTTWQRYNVLGLTPGTTYYIRSSALHSSNSNGNFTQSEWGPSATAATQNTSITIDVDITNDYVAGSSVPPYVLTMPPLVPEVVKTSTQYIVFRLSSNAMNGINLQIAGTNGALFNSLGNTIPAVSADLDASASGYGIRNVTASNTQLYNTYIGTLTVSATPNDFTDTAPTNKVGAPSTTFVKLFDSAGAPLHTGRSAFVVKAKPNFQDVVGSHTETITYIPVGAF